MKLPTIYAPLRRLNSICPYLTMFPLDFPFDRLSRANAGEWVLDPFCGRGTTNFAARLHGLPCVGVDSSPVAAAIAAAKHVHVSAHAVTKTCREILKKRRDPHSVPHGQFWKQCFAARTLSELCVLREELLADCGSETRVALTAVLLGILHGPKTLGEPTYISNQMPRTYATKPRAAVRYWDRHHLRVPAVNTVDAVERRSSYIFKELPPRVDGRVYLADSRELDLDPARPFSWVITSPPYLGMRTYVPDQWLRNWFIGGPATVDYSAGAQLGVEGAEIFARSLRAVWANAARACRNGAKLIVRFGAIPSLSKDAKKILKESLNQTDWCVRTIRDAGTSPQHSRQANQFQKPGAALREFDLYAVLER